MIPYALFHSFVCAEKTASLGDIIVQPLRSAFHRGAMRPHSDPHTARKLMRGMPKDLVHIPVPPEQSMFVPRAEIRNPYTGQTHKGRVVASPTDDPHLLAHELGHAHLDGDRYGKLLQNPVTVRGSQMLSPASTIGGVASGYMDEQNKEDHKGRDLGLIAGAHTPQLAYEGLASFKGDKLMREAGTTTKDIAKYRGRMGSAFGTYAMNPVASMLNYGAGRVAGGHLAKVFKQTRQSDKKKKKKKKG